MKKIGILGSGRLASIIAKAISSGAVEGVELTCIFSRNLETAKALGDEFSCFTTNSIDEFMEQKPDYVLEAAKREVVEDYTHTILEKGADILILTTGVFADQEFYNKTKEVALKTGQKVHLVPGAVGGFDIMETAKLMGDVSAKFNCTRKNITEETSFDGTIGELYAQNQNHLNVAISVALGCCGLDDTQASMKPATGDTRVSFETELSGNFGKAKIYTELGNQGPAMAAFSAVATLKRLVDPITF